MNCTPKVRHKTLGVQFKLSVAGVIFLVYVCNNY